MRPRERSGMTLVEISAGLALSGLALLGALLLMRSTADLTERLTQDSGRLTDAGVGRLVLSELLAGVEAVSDSSRRFHGDARSIQFPTSCLTSRQWTVRCDAHLGIDSRGDSSALIVSTKEWGVRPVGVVGGGAEFRYLDVSGGVGEWRDRWSSSLTPPNAVMVRSATETTLYFVGPGR